MSTVRLTGELICATTEQARTVAEHLPRHIALTRAEAGCISFEVSETGDRLVWQVEELFLDEGAFAEHQERVAASEWGSATAGIERQYSIEKG